ncbi:MAG: hypothetical protein ABII27_06095 [bacterium]
MSLSEENGDLNAEEVYSSQISQKSNLIKDSKDHFRKGESLLHKGSVADAIFEFKRAISKDSTNSSFYFALAKAYQIHGKINNSHGFYVLSMENLRKATEFEPSNQKFHDAKLDLALKAGLINELAEEYKELLKNNPENEIYKKFLQKINIISIVSIPDSNRTEGSGGNILVKMFVDYILSFVGFIMLIAGLMIKSYVSAGSKMYKYHEIFLNAGIVFLLIFLAIKLYGFISVRTSK